MALLPMMLHLALLFFFAAAAASSSSVVRLNRSKTRSVSMDAKPEFCWVTTELAMLSLKRCKLRGALAQPRSKDETMALTP